MRQENIKLIKQRFDIDLTKATEKTAVNMTAGELDDLLNHARTETLVLLYENMLKITGGKFPPMGKR